MQIDLQTLYILTVGTLVVAAGMMVWERQAHPHRARELGFWAVGSLTFVAGCVVATNRASFPGISGLAAANLIFITGYLLQLHGVRQLDGSAGWRWYAVTLAGLAALWALWGGAFPQAFWNHIAAIPIAAICGLTALTVFRGRAVRSLRSRPLAVTIPGGHAVFYLVRAAVVPPLAAAYGSEVIATMAKITMYEAVLYSVAMPMALVSLVREEAQERLYAAARTDYLTGLANRHGFFEQGGLILAERAADAPLTLLAFDLDHFKSINDRYGHAAGDAVIRLFARVVGDVASEGAVSGAVLARLGGEEFSALLPGQGIAEARRIGEQVARQFAEASAGSEGLGISATVSIGLVEARPEHGDLGPLLAQADRALYRAKALGRNRVEVAGPAAA
jgi:diguanylate cyclase (GGDEF)-like protein